MAFQPCPGIAQFELIFGDYPTGTFIGENTLHLTTTGGGAWDAAGLEAACEAIAGWWSVNEEPLYSNSAQLLRIESRDLTTKVAPQHTFVCNYRGDQTTQILPISNCIAISFASGLTGRTQRGRVFRLGLVEAQVEGSYLGSSFATALLDAWLELPVELALLPASHVILSRWLNGVKRAEGVGVPVATYSLTETKVDTQRRRIQRL